MNGVIRQSKLHWRNYCWRYTWNAGGTLKWVVDPDGRKTDFEYDALGRRTAKVTNKKITRYLWDGNVLLHEWSYPTAERPQVQVSELGEVSYELEPTESVTTWVYDEGAYTPIGKLINGERYSIISDYIGRPVQCFNSQGEIVWETDYDIYGRLKNLQGERNFIPFRQMGQYEDGELGGLYYNRFRYYDSGSGVYLSQDPIGLAGGMALYGYVFDSNGWVDPLGLFGMPKGGWNYNNMPKIDGHQLHHVIPRSMKNDPVIKAAGFDVDKPTNLIYLPKEKGTHPDRSLHNGWNKGHATYNRDITQELKDIHKMGKTNKWSQTDYAAAVDDLRNKTRKGLREGTIKCR